MSGVVRDSRHHHQVTSSYTYTYICVQKYTVYIYTYIHLKDRKLSKFTVRFCLGNFCVGIAKVTKPKRTTRCPPDHQVIGSIFHNSPVPTAVMVVWKRCLRSKCSCWHFGDLRIFTPNTCGVVL